MNRKIGLAPLIGLLVLLVFLTGCKRPGEEEIKPVADESSTAPTSSPSASPSPDDEETVEEPEDDGTAGVKNKDGKRETVPLVTSAPGDSSADTTSDTDTPPSLPKGICAILKDWQSLVDCVEDNQFNWYIDAVNERETKTGFDWSDIKRWAVAKTAKGNAPEVRVIRVYGNSVSNTEARKRAVELIGNAGNRLQIVRQPDCFANTRGLELGVMEDFVYCPPGSREVRVSLTPLRIKKGKVIGLLETGSGVFVDCQNVHWIPPVIKTPDDIQTVCYSNCNPGPDCTHDCQPPPEECPPGQTGTPPNCLEVKHPGEDPGPQGNAPEGGGHNDTDGPGDQTPEPTFPDSPHTNPPPPPVTHPPSGSTPTPPNDPPPPPPEPGSNPGDGGGSEGDPGGW